MANVLLLADQTTYTADTVALHINALKNSSRHKVSVYNPRGILWSAALNLDAFDAVIIHYSLVCCSDLYLHRSFRKKLHDYHGLKLQFIQDEYRWVDDITAAMRYIGVDVLFSMLSPSRQQQVYNGSLPGVKIVETLAGFAPPWPRPAPDRPRPIDVGYRGRVIPYWLGKLGQEKAYIAQRFIEVAPRYNLNIDIAWKETDRIYGDAWVDWLSSCKAVLGTESGSSITDWDRSIEGATRSYLKANPDAEFAEVFESILAPYEGNVMMNVVSPRVFEAAALGTGLILFDGEYGGIVQPWRNYIPLHKDFSNLDDVVAHLRDSDFMAAMVERTYNDLVASGKYSYRTMVESVDSVLDCAGQGTANSSWRYKLAQLERSVMIPPCYLFWVSRFAGEGNLARMVKLYVKRWRK